MPSVPEKAKAEPEPRAEEPPVVTTEVEEDTARRTPNKPRKNQPPAGANRPEAREVLVINVLARSGEQFEGSKLRACLRPAACEQGDMDIYHRHESEDTTTPVQFSVANAVEPGTFRPQDMAGLSTPGISFFMSLPGPTNALQAFEFMLETAQCVVRNLGGELKDERRSVMTPQTIEHRRQRIREFERKQRSQRAQQPVRTPDPVTNVPKTIRKRVDSLRATLEDHNYYYYVQDDQDPRRRVRSVVSGCRSSKPNTRNWRRRIRRPPGRRSAAETKLEEVIHRLPMLSLDNAFSEDVNSGILTVGFVTGWGRTGPLRPCQSPSWMVSPSVCTTKTAFRAATWGDGYTGEDIHRQYSYHSVGTSQAAWLGISGSC